MSGRRHVGPRGFLPRPERREFNRPDTVDHHRQNIGADAGAARFQAMRPSRDDEVQSLGMDRPRSTRLAANHLW